MAGNVAPVATNAHPGKRQSDPAELQRCGQHEAQRLYFGLMIGGSFRCVSVAFPWNRLDAMPTPSRRSAREDSILLLSQYRRPPPGSCESAAARPYFLSTTA
jgi:hypothetical protein